MDEKLIKRFENLVMPEPNSGCWIWNAHLSNKGYGFFSLPTGSSKTRKIITAHRFSYQAYKGEIPDGMLVCHTCDNRWCCNPDHLFLGTYKDNSDDKFRKGRFVVNGYFKIPIESYHKAAELKKNGSTVKEIYELTGIDNSSLLKFLKGKLRKPNHPKNQLSSYHQDLEWSNI